VYLADPVCALDTKIRVTYDLVLFKPRRMKQGAGLRGLFTAVAHKRYLMCVFCFLATSCAYVERTGFSVAFTTLCKKENVPERIEGMVMGAFYWGYGLSQVPGGFLAQRFGGRRTLIVSFIGWTVASFLTPRSATNALGMSAVRVVVGIFQGFLIPSVHTVLSQWVLPHERAKATSLCTSGMYLGSAAAIQFLPAVARRTGDPSVIFRLVAALGASWLALWLWLGEDVKHRDTLIPVTSAESPAHSSATKSSRKQQGPTPIKSILCHSAVWAIVINNFAFHYTFYVIMNWMPTYFHSLLGRDLQSIGIGKPIPYIVMFAMSNVGGWMGDALIGHGYSVAASRKAINSIGFWTTVLLLLVMPAARTVTQGLVMLSLCLGACGFSRGGFSVNHMDIAPKYAGIVMGISNTAGTVSGIIGVSATGFILEAAGGSEERAGWFQAHSVAACILLAASSYFIAAGRGTRQFH
jgi:MFS transporter, ACS family, solute carrier family 17 (sodium-dependent inorganic phosphate cotransporter), other